MHLYTNYNFIRIIIWIRIIYLISKNNIAITDNLLGLIIIIIIIIIWLVCHDVWFGLISYCTFNEKNEINYS